MLEHIEHIRAKQSQKQAEALAERQRTKQELETKRGGNIGTREALREQKNQQYCDYIRDLKTSEALRIRDQQNLVAGAKDKRRQQLLYDRKVKTEQENSAAITNATREENIRTKEKERDRQFSV